MRVLLNIFIWKFACFVVFGRYPTVQRFYQTASNLYRTHPTKYPTVSELYQTLRNLYHQIVTIHLSKPPINEIYLWFTTLCRHSFTTFKNSQKK